jgi:hypothetical protein
LYFVVIYYRDKKVVCLCAFFVRRYCKGVRRR